MDTARIAQVGDIDRVSIILDVLAQEIRSERGGTELLEFGPRPTPLPVHAVLTDWMEQDDRVLMVGLFDEVVVGVGAGTVGPSPGGDGHVGGLITACYVEPAARRVGVGTTLLSALLAWFESRGCRDIDATALPGDRSTKQLYETAGFKARLLTLHRQLD